MKTKQEIREIRKAITQGNCTFTVDGINSFQGGGLGYSPQFFSTSKDGEFIYEINSVGMGGGFNVKKTTENMIHLFTYTILHNRVDTRIKFNDINIIK